MVRVPGCDTVYDVANQWRDRCLASDRSLLWPDVQTWTPENLEVTRTAMDALVRARKTTGGDMQRAYADSAPAVRRAIGDAVAVWNLCPSSMRADTRKDFVSYVASWAEESPDLRLVFQAIDENVGRKEGSFFNPGYQIQRGAHLRFMLEFAIEVQRECVDVHDPHACRELASRVLRRISGSHSARNMVMHLLFPDEFEAVFNNWAKEKIVHAPAFSTYGDGIEDWDEKLAAIRRALVEQGYSADFDFYDPDIRQLWRPSPLKQARYWWVNQGKSYPAERDGGYIRGGKVSSSGAQLAHHQRMKEMNEGDLVLHYHAGAVLAIGKVIGPIVDKSALSDLRVEVAYAEVAQPIARVEFSADLLPASTGPFNSIGKINQGYLYELTNNWMRRFVHDFSDRLPEDLPYPEPLGPVDKRPSIVDLAARTHHDFSDLQEIESLLRDKKQLIFEGPPGSGKTFLADLFARSFTGNPLDGEHNEQIEVVQFHQSYGYEDFVQGIRPVTDGEGRLRYRVVPGIFLQHCERARANPDKRFVLIIDEINRGNLSRIFGELLMLLEYRDRRVRLPYASGDGAAEQTHLQIPPNLYLIGTMNSTDRSLAMIDYALRRRFYFYRLLPVVDGRATVLERWLGQQELTAGEQAWVLDTFVRINRQIGEHLSADFQIGHSYFMTDDIASRRGMDRVWRRALRPLLEEYFHTARGAEAIITGLAPGSPPPPSVSPESDLDVVNDDDPGIASGGSDESIV